MIERVGCALPTPGRTGKKGGADNDDPVNRDLNESFVPAGDVSWSAPSNPRHSSHRPTLPGLFKLVRNFS